MLVCASAADSFAVLFPGVAVAAVGIYSAIPIFWSFATGSLTGSAAASGLALINTFGSLGGFIAGYVTGWLRDATGGYQTPLTIMAVCLIVSGILAMLTVRTDSLSVTAPTTAPATRAG